MSSLNELKDTIFTCTSQEAFEQTALAVFSAQAQENKVYKAFIESLKINPKKITQTKEIPFLPISFFKTHTIKTGAFTEEAIFSSSGTSGSTTSKHFVKEINVYEQSFEKGFEHVYGKPNNYCILALLPSYLERSGSSLVYMANRLINQSDHLKSGFYLHNLNDLVKTLEELSASKTPTLLLGVSYALLDLAAILPPHFEHQQLTVMETGGMKGKRKEMIRGELHQILKNAFRVERIHSEYGMTELLSQAYSAGEGIFKTPPWMKVFARDTTDPLSLIENKKTGGLNIIDLANLNSCSFLATEDLGKVYADGTFEVLGRFDLAEIRGCNLMVN